MKNSMTDLIDSRATTLIEQLRAGKLSPHDLLDALEQRIAAVDGDVNALPCLCFDRARQRADDLLKMPVAERGLLCGLPVPIKDLTNVEGVRATFGSPVFENNISAHSDIVVETLEREGAIVYAKSNTPELGAGANTFNEVYGRTRNPRDLSKSAAGSSGGAAAALASGTAWLAHGSDNAGSLRSPASFCGVVGLRPTPGRVASGPDVNPYDTLSVEGPMARSVEDVALFLDAMSGADARDPKSRERPCQPFLETARERRKPLKIAFSPDLGITPVDAQVADICQRAAMQFEAMGIPVELATPDFAGVHECYKTLRAFEYAISAESLYREHREKLKPVLVDNIERGLRLTQQDVSNAFVERGRIRERITGFFSDFDVLLTPTAIVPPYPVEQEFVTACNDVSFEQYIDWLAIPYAITLVSLPALSLPVGYTREGLPVGLQMVTHAGEEGRLLGSALLLEESLGLDLSPIDPEWR